MRLSSNQRGSVGYWAVSVHGSTRKRTIRAAPESLVSRELSIRVLMSIRSAYISGDVIFPRCKPSQLEVSHFSLILFYFIVSKKLTSSPNRKPIINIINSEPEGPYLLEVYK